MKRHDYRSRHPEADTLGALLGWAKYMEWMYPVDVRITNKAAFRVAGALEAL